MTRLCTDGAEYGDGLFWNGSAIAANGITSAEKRSGAYSYQCDGNNANFNRVLPSSYGELYIRFGLRFSSITNAVILALKGASDTLANLGMTGGKLTLCGQTGSVVFGTAAWHLIEIHILFHNSTGAVEVKVDGLTDILLASGDTILGSDTVCTNLNWFGTSNSMQVDDIAVNDVAGGVDDSWCGDGHIELLVPSGNSPDGGWTDDWTGSDGNSTDNYLLVDEVPPASADYVEASVAANQDRYALTDFSGTGKQILRVWVEARAIDTVPEGAEMKLGLRLAAADYMSAAIPLSSNYTRIIGTVYKQNPATGPADWVDSDLDAAQIILEVV